MLLALGSAPETEALSSRNANAEILGAFDLNNKTEAKFPIARLGEAIQFVAKASVLGYDARAAMVFYGESGTPLRLIDCDRLWAKYGAALLEP
ncbi:hypothetical protein EN974_22815 [Mesorhizobium sp. M7A.F.Ca.CA.001.12.2.1]|nr:hypothetical protein EN974_22815 [Mesorhizobium sp. M7A.F.Ca.CA.001.12.2.1]RUZ16535.1 hypothetical protein EN949_31350 [Mesorhizobium sp. M7A.F.Ca.US.007.01.2.1]RUZ42471.1 hypothetical protein EN948_27790 [Mesorhizobium sp. M7A.F.Ca.US.003.02.1.1]RUZ63407.1 hypothetical protein EN950_15620 [Mesorhizobium sp. M7A.F.Ca.US.007.01.1.1]RUZ90376.1 hypothetical protein EN947_06490 [Mesorhizobium sp. M7A.F.Ca.US.003.02.2.1]